MNLVEEGTPTYQIEPVKLRTEIVIPGEVTPSLNDNNKKHWKALNSLRKRYERIVWAATRNQHKGPVRLEVYRHSSGTLDTDNFHGGAKQLIDALKNQKVIIDDKPAIVQQRHFEQVKIKPKGPKMMVIIITDL